ncbi:MAG: helix-turn-helix domain-containing protein [Muribaculaceae bacterium]
MQNDMQEVADLITAKTIFCTKEVLTSDEAARYMGISKSYLYKLTMGQKIPHYKPMGKMCYFNRVELENWLQSNRVATADEISQQAQTYCMKKGGR